jgi:hypothetical protein
MLKLILSHQNEASSIAVDKRLNGVGIDGRGEDGREEDDLIHRLVFLVLCDQLLQHLINVKIIASKRKF